MDTRDRLSVGHRLLARYRRSYGLVALLAVRRIVFDHPVGRRLPETLGIFVYGGLLIVVGLCVVHEALGVALDVSQAFVSAGVEFLLRSC